MITKYHAKYFAHNLLRASTEDGIEKISRSLFDACVDLNPHQIEVALFALKSPISKGVILADEEFKMLFLDTRNKLIAIETFKAGTVNRSVVFPRKVVERALYHHTVGVIIAHNHPAGSLDPSLEDKNITKAIRKALETVDIKLLDHIIIGGNKYFSFSENNF